jgi:DDB1- and CUL4-associated factor 13
VTSSIFSADARFVVTGSDDGNVRIWKAKASDKLGIITARERAAIEYRESLKERWKMDAQVGKVARSVQLIRAISPYLLCDIGRGTSRNQYIRHRS